MWFKLKKIVSWMCLILFAYNTDAGDIKYEGLWTELEETRLLLLEDMRTQHNRITLSLEDMRTQYNRITSSLEGLDKALTSLEDTEVSIEELERDDKLISTDRENEALMVGYRNAIKQLKNKIKTHHQELERKIGIKENWPGREKELKKLKYLKATVAFMLEQCDASEGGHRVFSIEVEEKNRHFYMCAGTGTVYELNIDDNFQVVSQLDKHFTHSEFIETEKEIEKNKGSLVLPDDFLDPYDPYSPRPSSGVSPRERKNNNGFKRRSHK